MSIERDFKGFTFQVIAISICDNDEPGKQLV